MTPLPADEASDHFTLISTHALIARASCDLEGDPVLRREVLLNLMRSLQEAGPAGRPPPRRSS